MDVILDLKKEKESFHQRTVTRTQEGALKALEEEYELAKANIVKSNDLRVLNSMIKRIGTLNHPRGRSGRI